MQGPGLGLESGSWNFSLAEDALFWEKNEWVPAGALSQPDGVGGLLWASQLG